MANPAFGSQINQAYINTAVTQRNIAEGGSSNTVLTDPLCDDLTAADGRPFFTGTRTDRRGANSGTCREFTEEWNFMSVGMERDSVAGAFDHAFSDTVEFYSFAQYSSSDIERSDSGAYTSRGPTMFLAQPGAHIGNPAWGGYSIGQPMELGYFAPAIGLARPTAADITNAPTDIRNGGLNAPSLSLIHI